MAIISLKLTSEQKKAIQDYAKLKNASVSQIILDAVLEKIEDEEDYVLAAEIAKTVDEGECVDFATLCSECGIDNEAL